MQALGVDLQQYLDRVPGPGRDLGCLDSPASDVDAAACRKVYGVSARGVRSTSALKMA
jgi:hypothetical protein